MEQEKKEETALGGGEVDLYDAVIVGGGPAGLTAALYLARARYRVVVVEKERFGGQIAITEEVVNYPGVAKTSGAALAETMRAQAASFGAEFVLAEVTSLDMEGDVKTVRTSRGELRAFGVLLATGARPRRLGVPGEERFQGRGVAYCATCDGEFFTGKEVFVVGGGFAAAEESVFLTKYASHVTILIRGDDFSCARAAAEEARRNPAITVLTNTEVEEIGGDVALRFMRYCNNKTGEVGEYRAPEGDTFGVFVLAGNVPATALLEGVAELAPGGYALVDERQQTTASGLYAAGDVCAKSLRQVVTATGEGALAATELERYVAAMQEKTGIVPARPAEAPAGEGRADAAADMAAAASSAGDFEAAASAADAGTAGAAAAGSFAYLSADMLPQLEMVFGRMAAPLRLELHVDGSAVAAELRGWMGELASCTDKLSVSEVADDSDAAPFVRVLAADGSDTGLAFHGVPGGHEFTGFVLGLYNAAGPGQPLDDETRSRLGAIDRPIKLEVLVSLSCTNCPDVVVAAQRIAAENPLVTADVYDVAHFPAFKDRYQVMSVPCLIANDGEQVLFGRKSLPQVLDALGC